MSHQTDASSPATASKPALRCASRARPSAAERRRENDPFDIYLPARKVPLTSHAAQRSPRTRARLRRAMDRQQSAPARTPAPASAKRKKHFVPLFLGGVKPYWYKDNRDRAEGAAAAYLRDRTSHAHVTVELYRWADCG